MNAGNKVNHKLNEIGYKKQKVDVSSIDDMAAVHEFSEEQLDELKIIHQNTKNDSLLKSMRELRTRVYEFSQAKNFICMVCSVVEKGGGSFVATNLASAIVLDKTKTAVLVDCNLYSASTDRLLPAPANVGLVDYLDDKNFAMADVIYASGIPRLRVLPLGDNVDGGTEKLTSERMKEALEELKNRYPDRYVIVDAPSVTDYDAEVRILSELCDLVVLVVPKGLVTREQLDKAVEAVDKHKLAAVIYNNTELS